MKYPLIKNQTIEYNTLHALEAGYTGVSDIETYLRDSGKAVYPRQISGSLQRLKKAGIVEHKSQRERDRWKLVHNACDKGRGE